MRNLSKVLTVTFIFFSRISVISKEKINSIILWEKQEQWRMMIQDSKNIIMNAPL